jgi:hypothetical protein
MEGRKIVNDMMTVPFEMVKREVVCRNS